MLDAITMTTTSTLGELIREARLARGMSMGQLASAVGRTAASVRRWERDEAVPPAEVLQRLAEVLEIDLSGSTSSPEPPPAEEADDAPPQAPVAIEAATDAVPLPIAQDPTTVAVAVEPEVPRRTVRYYLRHLFDPDRPYLGYLRAALTVIVGIVLLWILVWALRELFEALARVWDQFGTDETDTTEAMRLAAALLS